MTNLAVDGAPHDGATDDEAAGLVSINAQLGTRDYLRSMWDLREFAVEVPLEEMRSQHKTTLLGNVWHLGNPLLTIAVYFLVFGALLGSGNRPEPFLLWLTIGVFAFRQTQSSVLGGAKSLVSNAGLMKAMKFPRALLPVSVVISNLLTFSVELLVLAVIVELYGLGVSRRWLLLPVVLVVHAALNLGLGFVAARLNDNFRDVEQIIPFLFRLAQYLSGVMVPLDRLISREEAPAIAKLVLALNPMAAVIEAYRWIFIGQPLPVVNLLRTGLLSAAVLWFGFRYFRAAEWRYGRT